MLMDAEESQLVLVDFQARLKPAMLDADAVWANAARLATLAHALAVPTWGTEQNPSRLGEMPAEIRSHCRKVLAKMQFSAVEEGLGEWLQPEPPQAPKAMPAACHATCKSPKRVPRSAKPSCWPGAKPTFV
ncbi:MAG: hypothetical protein RLZZ280_1885 [Pseudomonadota bacterium]